MFSSRRSLIKHSLFVTGLLSLWHQEVSAQRAPQPLPSPHAPDPHFPPGLNGPDIKPDADKRTVDPQTEKEIRADIEKLYALVSDLKNQADKTDLNSMLSVPIVKKAQEIEKLAKQIKQLSKG